jgi:hypothetical protein
VPQPEPDMDPNPAGTTGHWSFGPIDAANAE